MPCIYTTPEGLCQGTEPLSRREHYLPRALGNFKGDERLKDKICLGCQRNFRDAEDVFIHSGAEAFFREMVGQVGRKRQRKKSIFYEPTFAIAPLTITATPPGGDTPLLWELVDEGHCTPLKQMIIKDSENRTAHIPFRSGALSQDVVTSLVHRQGISRITDVITLGGEDDQNEMQELTAHLIPSGHSEQRLLGIEEGAAIEGEMKALISAPYLRAIAKIGFHFFLQRCPEYHGTEREFDSIKQFIYSGMGVADSFVWISNHEILVGLGRVIMLRQWSHLLCCDCDDEGIRVRVQFFCGPKVVPFIWEINVGRNPRKNGQHKGIGVGFVYFQHQNGAFHGERVPLTSAALLEG